MRRPGKRLQLLCDSCSWRHVIRESDQKQKLWPPAAGLRRMAEGHLSGLCSEELHQPASAAQQVRLQKVLRKEGPLSFWNDFTNKEFNKKFLMCSAHIENQKTNQKKSYYWLYLCLEELPQFYFWCVLYKSLHSHQVLIISHLLCLYCSSSCQVKGTMQCECALCSCRFD